MKAIVLRCNPGSRFHFGKYAPDDDTALNDSDDIMHSDTLFAALVNIYQGIFGDAQELVDAFETGQIKNSSLLYCLEQNDKYIWLLPKPVSFNLFASDDYKTFRGIRFISKQVWETIESPESLMDETRFQLFSGNMFAVQAGEVALPERCSDEKEKKRVLKKFRLNNAITLPKVRVAESADNQIYQLTVTEIADNSEDFPHLSIHYYFLMEENNLPEKVAKNLSVVIAMLPYSGIGAEKSTIGKVEGFETINNWEANIKDEGFMATLSLYSPSAADSGKAQYYKTVLRGGRRLGRIDDNENRYLKTARMILEGAILQKSCTGSLVDVSPRNDRTYLRNGKPIGLPARSQWIPEL